MKDQAMKKVQFSYVRAAVLLTGFYLTVCACNVLQMLTMIVFPFSRNLFRKLNRAIAGFYWGSLVFGMKHFMLCDVHMTGDQLPREENAIVFANHQCMADIPVVLWVAKPTGRIGDLKWFLKDVFKYVPGPGWGLFFLDGIFVKRDWNKDKNRIRATFEKFNRLKLPIWVVTFPEGTRKTPKKLQLSQEYAKKLHSFYPTEVMIPRVKGFSSTVEGVRNCVDAVYDISIVYPQGAPSLFGFMGYLNLPIHIHVKRYAIRDLPVAQDDLAKWLMTRFEEKNQFIQSLRGKQV